MLAGVREVNLRTGTFKARLAILVGSVFALACAPAAAQRYTVVDLGELGAGGSFPRAINISGQVVGNSDGHAFLYKDGSMRNLDPRLVDNAAAFAINDAGDVAGWSQDASLDVHAFLYSKGTITWLTSPELDSAPTGINASRQIVGWSGVPNANGGDGPHAFLWSAGTLTVLTPDVNGVANAINASGQVVGKFHVPNAQHAFLYSNGSLRDLGTLHDGNGQSEATAINDNGDVVGWSGSQAFIYTNGEMTDLGSVANYADIPVIDPSSANYAAVGINDRGEVVGNFGYCIPTNFFPYCTPGVRTWVYSDGVMRDLGELIEPNSGWEIAQVTGINAAGEIIAFGCGDLGCHALMLAPVTSVVEYGNTEDFPGSPGGHFFYTDDPAEQALVDSGVFGRFVRTGKSFSAGGAKRLCRFYGSVTPGPNSHFYTIADSECNYLKSQQKVPAPTDTPQWNYEGLVFAEAPAHLTSAGPECLSPTVPVYRAYNNAFPLAGARKPWDSGHRYSVDHRDISRLVDQYGWRDEGIVFCAPK